VVHVSNFFRANQTVYMVMEYADGRSLGRELELAGGRLEERRIRKWFAALLSGLREVHLHRLLHLDIKPANIYLRRSGYPLLLDFGAARQTLSRRDKHFASMYTPGFAAPEQYEKDQPLGPWTDIYAVGACLYVCMGGSTPQIAQQRLQADKLVPASKLFRHYYSKELLELTDQCLNLAPDARPPPYWPFRSVCWIPVTANPNRCRNPPWPPSGWWAGSRAWLAAVLPEEHAMKLSLYQESRIGGRSYNQDRQVIAHSREAVMLVVADGMGGHLQGEVAAQITIDLMSELFYQQATPSCPTPTVFW
jgi:serine/threonine protein kinase